MILDTSRVVEYAISRSIWQVHLRAAGPPSVGGKAPGRRGRRWPRRERVVALHAQDSHYTADGRGRPSRRRAQSAPGWHCGHPPPPRSRSDRWSTHTARPALGDDGNASGPDDVSVATAARQPTSQPARSQWSAFRASARSPALTLLPNPGSVGKVPTDLEGCADEADEAAVFAGVQGAGGCAPFGAGGDAGECLSLIHI